MAGQLIPRGKGVWLVRVYLGVDPDIGKGAYHNKTVHGNKKDAETHLTRTLRDRDTGKPTAGAEKLTSGGLLDDVLTDYRLQGGWSWSPPWPAPTCMGRDGRTINGGASWYHPALRDCVAGLLYALATATSRLSGPS